ncbi:hypothetical protein Nepgr_005447 [Nepenthes gracilis]|uniref:F-box domain-containing protein n=1 Tax=Nepenthes gracilis TaxID=150966 RepID=A0AAD3S3A2_NEPGR|nr:hypothetical protein Nepgr_005447 [Nepenthes gracilis]
MPEKCADIPEEIWEQIISNLDRNRQLEPLSLVSKRFLSITNRFKQTLKISDPTSYFLPKLFHRFPNLKHISLLEFQGNPNSILLQISQFRFPLESLDLSNQKELPIEAIRALSSSSLSSIRSLILCSLSFLSDQDLATIAQMMPNLEALDLSEPRDDYNEMDLGGCGALGITDDGIALLASKLGNLRTINLSGNYLISDKSVASLCENCGNLEEIVVKNCNFITQNGISFALRSCVNLRSFCLLGIDVAAPDISDSLTCARNLCVLDFSYMGVSDGLLFAIAKACLPLKKFTLFHCQNFTFSGILSLLRTYQSLEYLALEGVYFLNDRSMIDLAKFLRNANTIKLNFCSRLSDSTFFTLIKNCPSLNSLEMEKTDMGKQEFTVNNVNNPKIRALYLASNKTLSNECLEKIATTCPNLELLDVSYCSAISRKGIGEIVRNCRSLRHIQISGCGQIKNLGMEADLHKLEVLQASGSGLNDEGLMMIGKKCSGLMYLDVMCCNGVSSRGVKEVVRNCTKLREINLNWCRNVSRDIIAWMVFSRPSLRKIVPPHGSAPTENEKSLFLRHGCHVCEA